MRAVLWIIIGLTAVSPAVFAQTDEIQVYDAESEPPGIFNLMFHSNFTPAGRTVPVFPGAIIADHSFNGTAEWAYGVTPWMEQGLYLPVYTIYWMNHATTINGFKIRELFVRPHAHDHTFFYGVNYEFSVNALYWEDRRVSSEIRPIVGLHLHPGISFTTRLSTWTLREVSATFSTTRPGESPTTSMTGGPSPRKRTTASAHSATLYPTTSSFTKSGP